VHEVPLPPSLELTVAEVPSVQLMVEVPSPLLRTVQEVPATPIGPASPVVPAGPSAPFPEQAVSPKKPTQPIKATKRILQFAVI
jgi:hypothetical protein